MAMLRFQLRKMSLAALRDPLSTDDALAMVLELAGAQVRLEHRRLRLLRLKHQRVLAVAADEQEDRTLACPTLPTPTTLRAMSTNR